jgi:hypothetical protein
MLIAHRHADSQRHYVLILKDGHETILRPARSKQLLLIDDLMMPD